MFIELFHVPPEKFGLYFGTNAVGIITASQFNRWLALRIDARRIVRAVLFTAMTAGIVLLVNASTGSRRVPGHPRAAVLLHCLSRLRDAEHDGARHRRHTAASPGALPRCSEHCSSCWEPPPELWLVLSATARRSGLRR